MVESENLYVGREQTLVKHFLLRKYLERFAHIIGSTWASITYVDGFSGPWNIQSDDFEDSSFAIALKELRKARDTHRKNSGKDLHLRCYFLERSRKAFASLQEFTRHIADVEIVVNNDAFENATQDILTFIQTAQPSTFPFVFIDPTGWTGFKMDAIAPLLRHRPSEALINFMTGHIQRFIKGEASKQSFEALFGSSTFYDRARGLSGRDKVDAIVEEYCDCVARRAAFDYVLPAMVSHPTQERTYFHLIYATRNGKGVEVFKQAEKQAMKEMEKVRASAEARQKEKSGQKMLSFEHVEDMPESSYYRTLRDRYLSKAQAMVREELESDRSVAYDDLWRAALTSPLVWESDLKDWIKAWKRDGHLEIQGLPPRSRVPQRGKGHRLVWKGTS